MIRRSLLAVCLCLLGASLQAAERIIDFHSQLQVFTSGELSVTETIVVRAEGQDIKRGIYRDFPTVYEDHLKNKFHVTFEVVSVQRDGRPEAYHTQPLDNGVRVYMGRQNVRLQPGVYTYTLQYRTQRQLGFFDQHDELYWNVTGNGWAFPIERARASVVLPHGIPAERVRLEAYTGPQGSREQAYLSEVTQSGVYRFETVRLLQSNEGLSIVVTWPKGHVQRPDLEQQMAYVWHDHRPMIAGGAAWLLVLGYYVWAWWRVGRDPQAGVVVTLYEPPSGFSPASMRFIQRMGYDDKTFASALIQLAVKGDVQIQERHNVYTVVRAQPASPQPLAAGEKALLSALFTKGDRLTLKQTNHEVISAAKQAHETSLANDHEKQYFNTNRSWLVPGLLLSVLTVLTVVLTAPTGEGRMIVAFMLVWLTFWSMGTAALIIGAYHAWRAVAHQRFVGVIRAVFTSLFSVPFVAGWVGGMWALAENSSWSIVLLLVMTLLVNGVFYQWLKAPTRAGRRLLDQIEGFGRYLTVAEGDDLNIKHPAGKTVETFERFLPYALALDVEQAWAESFAETLQTAKGASGRGYHPAWYSGQWDSSNPVSFSRSVGGALAQSVSAASRAPGSASGSGGGGSSGGGGGGGGGGGW